MDDLYPLLIAEDLNRTKIVADDLIARYAEAINTDTARYIAWLEGLGVFHLIIGYLCESILAGYKPSFLLAVHRTGTWPAIARAMNVEEGIILMPGDASIFREVMTVIYENVAETPEEIVA